MSFADEISESLVDIKETISSLFERSKEQAIAFQEKDHATFNELLNIQKRDSDTEDSFLDGGKIQQTTNLSLDKDGWTNSFTVVEIPFLDEYYTKQSYPMSMVDGRIIPGSNFSDIFLDREGFWGYMRDDNTSVDAEFALTFKLRPEQQSIFANKIYLMTTNLLDVEAFYRPAFGQEWVSLGTRPGRNHLWNQPFSGVEVRFAAKAPVFSISFVAISKAIFSTSGSLISTYYTIDNLRMLSIDDDSEVPQGTSIRKFVHITSTEQNDPPISGWIPWDEEDIVTLASTEIEAPVISGYVIPSGFIEESLVLRSGYNKWDDVSTTDLALVTESVDRLGDNFLDIPTDYKVISGGLKAVFVGDGDSRTEFSKDDDYIVQYNTTNDTIRVDNIPGGRMDSLGITVNAEVLLRKPVNIVQRRTFVDLIQDSPITISIPTAGISVRTLNITDSIENDVTVQDVPLGTYEINGRQGLNLIEVSGHNISNPPELMGVYTYFARRYWEKKVESVGPHAHEFYLDPATGGLKVVSPETFLFIRYLLPTNNNKVSVKFELDGTQSMAPLLRSYRLVNVIDKI